MGSSKQTGAWLVAGGALLALACGGEESTATSGSGAGASGPGSGGNGGTPPSSGGAPGQGGEGAGIDIPGGFGGGVDLTCDAPGEPGTIYELEAESLSIAIMEPVPMCIYREKVLLIANVAAL
jgi:hypothetical protein